MSCGMHAKLVPYSSVVGQAITLHNMPGDPVFAQIVVMAPAGPPPGEDHATFVKRIAKAVADAINQST